MKHCDCKASDVPVRRGYAWEFNDPIYRAGIMLYCCEHGDMVKSLLRYKVKVADVVEEPPAGKCIEHYYDSGRRLYIVWIRPGWRERDLDDMNTLVHEVMHVTMTVLMRRGVNADCTHEEPYCYFAGWLFEQCLARLRTMKRKKR